MALLQTRLQEISVEISRVSRSEVEPLKDRCRKMEFEIMNLLRRVQEAQEGANRVPELERELKSAKERIEKLELSSVQTADLHQQSMSQAESAERARNSAPESHEFPCIGGSETMKDEYGKRIQELQIWVQALNGGTSALVDPRSWKNPILGIQAEQTTQKAQWEELHYFCSQLRNQHHGLLKDSARQQDKFDRLPIETLQEKYRKLETRIG